jgi:hypothetical protein
MEAIVNMAFHKRKAMLTTIMFALAGVASLVIHRTEEGIDWGISMPLIIFYIALCINTYFSIKLFSQIISHKSIPQNLIDFILAGQYLALAWFLHDRNVFIFLASLMFATATIKYSSILGTNPYLALFKRKIFTDNIGALGTIAAYGGSIFLHPTAFVWPWALGFVIANIYLLAINPLYKID